jgi:hypothetical protein
MSQLNEGLAALKIRAIFSAASDVAAGRSLGPYSEDSLNMLMVEGTSSTQANWLTSL